MLDRREVLRCGSLALAVSATTPASGALKAASARTSARTRLLTAEGMTIDIRRVPGNGHAIVLVHGLGQSHLVWNATMRSLPGSRAVVAYDQRGHGGSSKPDDVGAYSDGGSWADDLHQVLRAYGGPKPILVGWSLGGLVMTHYLAKHSDAALGGVVFVSAVTDGSPELMTQLTGSLLRDLAEPAIEQRTAAAPAFVDASFATTLPPVDRTSMIVANASVPTAVYQAVGKLPPADIGLLTRITVPTLVVHGLRDRLVSPEMARRAAKVIPGAQLRLFESSGHGPLIDEPARLARDIEALAASLD